MAAVYAIRNHNQEVACLARGTYNDQAHAHLRAEQESIIEAKIRDVYDEHKGRYGYKRITAAHCGSLAEPNSHKCVQRPMKKMGLRALAGVKKRYWLVPGVSNARVPNVLQRDFFAKAPNQKWGTDVNEFNVNGQKLYVSACMDLYNSKIIAHRMARRGPAQLHSLLKPRAHRARIERTQAGGIPVEKYRLTDRIATLQLLGGSSIPGRFTVLLD